MNCWSKLQIEKTTDKKQIKKAYHKLLKLTKPEENEKGFMELRAAYEQALEYKEYAEDEEEWEEEDFDEVTLESWDEDSDIEEELSEEEQAIADWQRRVAEVYEDYEKRIDATYWKNLLYENLPAQIKYYEACKRYLYWPMVQSFRFLPHTVSKLLDDFFSYTGTEVERAKNEHREQSRRLNKIIKLNETIEFNKLLAPKGAKSQDIDRFFAVYTELCEFVLRWQESAFVKGNLYRSRQIYEEASLSYPPYECLAVALQMEWAGAEKTEVALTSLKEKYSEIVEVRLLSAEFALYQGEKEQAKTLLKKLYQEIPEKSYPFAYQMAMCCKTAGMYYEAYELVKYLTWMRPESWHFKLAEEICTLLEEELKHKTAIEDADRIALCRIYLRSNRETEALEVLEQVEKKDGWEYNMAYSLCSFRGEEKVCANPPCYVCLVNAPKDELNVIQRLEWEDLQARYWYEQGMYKESIEQCNRLLQEYPISYPVLLLRSYVDYSWGQYKQRSKVRLYGGEKDFVDLDYLLALNGNRVETRLLMACVQRYAKDYECALKILEPIKEKVPLEYEYCRLYLLDTLDTYEDAMTGWMVFWEHVKNHPVQIPSVSKYYLIDLNEIYKRSGLLLRYIGIKKEQQEQKRAYYECLKDLANSACNHPERYVDYVHLYNFKCYDDFDEAEQYILRKLALATDKRYMRDIYDALQCLYRQWNQIEKAEQIYKQIPNNMLADFSVVYMDTLFQEKAYDRLINFCEEKRKKRECNRQGYRYLGKAYYNIAEYPKAREVWEEAVLLFSQTGDYGDDENLYYDIADSYIREKNWKTAFHYLKLGRRNTKQRKVKDRYAEKYADACTRFIWEYVKAGEIKKVHEYVDNVPKESKRHMNYAIACTYFEYIKQMETNKDCTEYIEKAKDYFRLDIEAGRRMSDSYGSLIYLYNKTMEYDLAQLFLKQAMELCLDNGHSGDYWQGKNFFKDAYDLCMQEENWMEAINYLEMMLEHTELQSLKEDYGENYARAYQGVISSYIQNGDVETVEELCQSAPSECKRYLNYALGLTYDNCITFKEDSGADCTELIECAIVYYQNDIQEGFSYLASYGRQAYMYNKLGRRKEAVELLNEVAEVCIKHQRAGDYWGSNNLFQEQGHNYHNMGQWEAARKYFELWREQSVYGREVTELEYAEHATEVYFKLEEYSTAYKLWKLAYEKKYRYDMVAVISLAMAAFGMEKYSLSRKFYIEAMALGGAPAIAILIHIAHCEYMENGNANKEVFENLRDEILSYQGKEGYEEEDFFYILADLALLLEDKTQAKEYVAQADTYSWKNENDKTDAEIYYNIWRLVYEENYESAYQYIVDTNFYKMDSEIQGLWSYLKKKLKEKLYYDTWN